VIVVCAAFANVLMVYSFWAVAGLALACLNIVKRDEWTKADSAKRAGASAP
jgi:hypothetical protein